MADEALSVQTAVDADVNDVLVIGRIDATSGNFEVKKVGASAAATGAVYEAALDSTLGTDWKTGKVLVDTITETPETDQAPTVAAVAEYVNDTLGDIETLLVDING